MSRAQIAEIVTIITVFGIMISLSLWRQYQRRKALERRINSKLKDLNDAFPERSLLHNKARNKS